MEFPIEERMQAVESFDMKYELTLRGNDIRFVLRPDGVEVLPSTRFTLTEERGPDGSLHCFAASRRNDVEGQVNGGGPSRAGWGVAGGC